MDTRGTWRVAVALAACAVAHSAVAISMAGTLYVNGTTGQDWNNGRCEVEQPGCGPKKTIQAALIEAVEGDIIVLADGIYTGASNKNLSLGAKVKTMRSASGDPRKCIIDCEGSGRGVSAGGGVVLDGFTIRNGYFEHGFGSGGAVYGSDLTIKNCIFSSNTADDGGAIYAQGTVTLVSCTLISNHARYRGGGVFIPSWVPGARLANCAIVDNTAGWYGGGIYAELQGSGYPVGNCTIARNVAGWYGGGLYATYNGTTFASCDISNSIFAENVAQYGHEMALDNEVQPKVFYTNVYGDAAAIWVGGGAFVQWWFGNLNVDPHFFDPNRGDFRLQRHSPCVDVGGNDWIPWDWADLDRDGNPNERVPFDCDGNPRLYGDYPTVDMGAYEYRPGDVNCDHRIDYGDINAFVAALSGQSAYEARYPECQWMTADINDDGVINYGDINPFVAALGGG